MSARLIIGIIAGFGISICGIASMLAYSSMADKVNERLPKESQFSPMGWNFPKSLRLRREYRRNFPGGNLLLRTRILAALGIACLLLSAWSLGLLQR
jgi:hypothetical protein